MIDHIYRQKWQKSSNDGELFAIIEQCIDHRHEFRVCLEDADSGARTDYVYRSSYRDISDYARLALDE